MLAINKKYEIVLTAKTSEDGEEPSGNTKKMVKNHQETRRRWCRTIKKHKEDGEEPSGNTKKIVLNHQDKEDGPETLSKYASRLRVT